MPRKTFSLVKNETLNFRLTDSLIITVCVLTFPIPYSKQVLTLLLFQPETVQLKQSSRLVNRLSTYVEFRVPSPVYSSIYLT